MKKIFIGLLIGIVLGIIIGIFASKNFPSEYVCVTVHNKSGKNIRSLTLKSNSGSIQTNDLRNKEEVNFTFKNGGEGVYSLVSIFDNDSTIKSQKMYIEGGYRTIETVYSNHIESKYK